MDIPKGLSMAEEHDVIRSLQWREGKEKLIEWLTSLRPEWKVKADLTYAIATAAPEQVEKRVRWWLRLVAPGCTAICGIELQQRGSAHAHVIIDQYIDFIAARKLWQDGAGWCWLQAVRNSPRAIGYAIKDTVKRGALNIYGPGSLDQFDTRPRKAQRRKNSNVPKPMNPNDYEREAIAKLRAAGRDERGVSLASTDGSAAGRQIPFDFPDSREV